LVGSAQRREGRALLQHGSILLDGAQSIIHELRCVPDASPASPHATLRELLGRVPEWRHVADAIIAGFGDCGIRLAPATLTREERAAARVLLARFENDAWTWRR
ncbi:MAG: hypothetical protein ACRELX_16715, partial [Longimicrobiales bacterium]